MKTKVIAGIGTALLLALPVTLPAAGPSGQGDANTVAQQNAKNEPRMAEALQHLAAAKKALEAGSQQHGGHRVKALDHVNQAISETEQAVAYWNQQQASKKK
jgi:hypothetical protein